MAGKAGITALGTRDPGAADSLTASEQEAIRNSDEADVSPRAAASDLSGKRIRAIPSVITKNQDRSTKVEVRQSDFAKNGITHRTVVFDFQKDNYTLRVGDDDNAISKEAADFLTKNYPLSFEYING